MRYPKHQKVELSNWCIAQIMTAVLIVGCKPYSNIFRFRQWTVAPCSRSRAMTATAPQSMEVRPARDAPPLPLAATGAMSTTLPLQYKPEPLPSRADKSAGEIAVERITVATRSAYLGYSPHTKKPPNQSPRATAVFVWIKSSGASNRPLGRSFAARKRGSAMPCCGHRSGTSHVRSDRLAAG